MAGAPPSLRHVAREARGSASGGRLPPIGGADWPAEIADMRTGFAGRLNVYRTMAHHPALLKSWAELRQHVVLENTLGARRLELVILRIAHRLGSAYEWAHHTVRGRAAGLSEAEIDAAASEASCWAPNEADTVLFGAVDELLDKGRLGRGTLDVVADSMGLAGVLDLMATVGMYSTLAFITNTFETPLDSDLNA